MPNIRKITTFVEREEMKPLAPSHAPPLSFCAKRDAKNNQHSFYLIKILIIYLINHIAKIFKILYVQVVVTHLYSKLLYKLGQDFWAVQDIQFDAHGR